MLTVPLVLVAGLTSGSVQAAVPTATPAPAAAAPSASVPAGRAAVASDRPAYSKSGVITGSVPDAQVVSFAVDLPLTDPAGAQALATAISTPGSAQFGKYLTPAQYQARFSPSPASVAALSAYLTGKGLTVGTVNASRTSVAVSGSAINIYDAFGAYLKTWSGTGNTAGAALVAPDRTLSVPTAYASLISGVRGLAADPTHVTPRSTTDAQPDVPGSSATTATTAAAASGATSAAAVATSGPQAPPPAGFSNAQPCSSYYGEKLATTLPKYQGQTLPYVPCGYTPQQLRSAYGIDTLINNKQSPVDGRGQTVAIVDAYAAPTIVSDSNTYSANHGLAGFSPGQFTQAAPPSPYMFGYDDTVNGDQCGEQGWYGEETLDVEAVHGVAPGANILYQPAASCDNLDFATALQTIVDAHSADIVSNSYGSAGEDDDPSTFQAYNNAFIQGAAEGITFLFSSGDDGDEVAASGVRETDLPASNPNVTAVGGTAIAIGKDGKRAFETGWGTANASLSANGKKWTTPTYLYGGGGGTSQVFSQPAYQAGVVPDSLSQYYSGAGGTKYRVEPDVSMIADPQTGFLVGETQTFLKKPGVNNKTTTGYGEYRIGGTSLASPAFAGIVAIANQAGGFKHGFLNPSLYPLVGTSYVNDPSDPTVTHAVVRENFGTNAKTGITDPSTTPTPFLRTLNDTASLAVAPGYDDVTGIGEPAGIGFITHLGSPYGPPATGTTAPVGGPTATGPGAHGGPST